MRPLLSILALFISFTLVSQSIERVNISGKLIVEGSDIEGIVIYNTSTNTGTVTNERGEFIIAAALNDVLAIRALAYQDIDVRVNEAVMASKRMSIYLIEEMIMLDEVAVARELSGNLASDAGRVDTYDPKLDAFYFGISDDDLLKIGDDGQSQIKHLDRNEQGKTMVNGLNVVNIVDQLLIPLFRSEVKNKKEAGVPEVPAENVKYYLGSDFLVENFNIPEHRVEEFIRYVEDESFDYNLLNYGHELELLNLLSQKSKTFLETTD